LGELNDQLLWLDLDARNVGVDEAPIVNRGITVTPYQLLVGNAYSSDNE
jgi:hypothetical protein